MKVHIDISVHAGNVAVGMSAGELHLAHMPRVGEFIDFAFAAVEGVMCPVSAGLQSTRLRVESVSYAAGELRRSPHVSLDVAVVESVEAGIELLEYFATGFELFSDVFVEQAGPAAGG